MNPNPHATVVLGANYGDEGKGLVVDALVRRAAGPGDAAPLVVRFSGGAQAGHTVVAPGGRRHVCHHVGSGALAGATTLLARGFIANPCVLPPELDALAGLGVAPRLIADPAVPLTTPWDMVLNQMIETRRDAGGGRHGSCGLGVHETVVRHRHTDFALTACALECPEADLLARLRAIRERWVPHRAAELGLNAGAVADWLRAPDAVVYDRYLEDLAAFRDRVAVAEQDEVLRRVISPDQGGEAGRTGGAVIFESSQGLGLDEQIGVMPYCTPTPIALGPAAAAAAASGCRAVDAVYVTRCYLTRHGPGPMTAWHEATGSDEPPAALRIDDPTNRPNPWQGTLRSGPLDLDAVLDRIGRDRRRTPVPVPVVPHLVMSCLDQAAGALPYVVDGRTVRMAPEAAARHLARRLGAATLQLGRGPTHAGLESVAIAP